MILQYKYSILSTVVLIVFINSIFTAPVQQPKQKPVVEGGSKDEVVDTGLEYDRYLREIVSVLEEDEDFRKKLEAANVSEIKDGSIARHLEFVGHNVRTKLDEIKRREVDRLQELARLKMKQMKGAVRDIRIPGHLDVMNPHSFEMKDLESLIKKTTNDLEELDKQRRDEFKEYEMEKQYEEKEKLKHLPEEERKKEEERLADLKKKHGQHEKINHPASKDQLEEVWENTDHLDKEDFDPKTFFLLHDANGDGVWSIDEVEALLQHELDKAYDEKNTDEDDPIERVEEMNRMREHIFTEIDLNKDKFITREEFLIYTGPKGDRKEFEENDDWKTLDQEDVFDDGDYRDFLKEHHQQEQDNMPHDPSVVNMNIPHGDQQQQYQQQLAAQQQMLAAQQQQAAQMAQQQHAAIQQQAQVAQQQILAAQQQHMAAQQQQLNQGQGLHNQGSQGVNPPGMNGVPVQQPGLHQQQQQQFQQQQQPVVQQQGQGQQQQQFQQGQAQQQQPVVQQGQQPGQAQQAQGQQQQPVVQQQQAGQQPVQPNQVHVNQV